MKRWSENSRRGAAWSFIFPVLGLLVLASASLAGTDKEKAQAPAGKARAVAARVNGAPIYEDQLSAQMAVEFRKYRKFGARKPTPDLEKVLRNRALEKLITVEVVYQASQGLDIPDFDKKIEKRLRAAKTRPVHSAPEMTDTELRENIRQTIAIEEYLKRAGVTSPEVPETEIKDYYEKNKKSFMTQETVHVRHILVQVAQEAKNEKKAIARKRIEKARKSIQDGRPFEEVAREYSEDNAASAGGDIGFIRKGYMPKEFDEVAFTIEPGKLSEIVQTIHGYHILEVVEKQPEGVVPYEKVKDFVGKYLSNELAKKKRNELVQALKAKAKIEVLSN